jgi:hypothetical protein
VWRRGGRRREADQKEEEEKRTKGKARTRAGTEERKMHQVQKS